MAAVCLLLMLSADNDKSVRTKDEKLQFIASCPQHGVLDHPPNECHITQEYVAALLFKQLGIMVLMHSILCMNMKRWK